MSDKEFMMVKKVLIGVVAAVLVAGGVMGVVSASSAFQRAKSADAASVEVNVAQEGEDDPLQTQAETQVQQQQRLQIHDPENPGTETATQTQTRTRLRELQEDCDGTCECEGHQLRQNLGDGQQGHQMRQQQDGTCDGSGDGICNGSGVPQGNRGNGKP